jgi:effector-binding domain-containing protein
VVCEPQPEYATVTHQGHPRGLIDVTATLLDWAEKQGLRFDVTDADGGQRWACGLESYLTDPAQQPGMTQWETRLDFRLAE